MIMKNKKSFRLVAIFSFAILTLLLLGSISKNSKHNLSSDEKKIIDTAQLIAKETISTQRDNWEQYASKYPMSFIKLDAVKL